MSNNEMSTAPTIETLLSRINQWGEQFTNELKELKSGQEELQNGQKGLQNGQEGLQNGQEGLQNGLDELRKGQDELRKAQEELRNELNAGLRRVERKIEILNDNILTVNADIRDLEVRLEKLEAEPLAKN